MVARVQNANGRDVEVLEEFGSIGPIDNFAAFSYAGGRLSTFAHPEMI